MKCKRCGRNVAEDNCENDEHGKWVRCGDTDCGKSNFYPNKKTMEILYGKNKDGRIQLRQVQSRVDK